jgi:redox-sensitive bicupin YhaK (pirin superfamily)
MTAGRAIMHEEMPQVRPEGIDGFQLWVNLPARLKMSQPRYQDIAGASIPVTEQKDGARIRVITGSMDGIRGPVTGIAADPVYVDVFVPAHHSTTIAVPAGYNSFAYVFEGAGTFGSRDSKEGVKVGSPKLVVFGDGDEVDAFAGDSSFRFVLAAGKPLNEPVVRYGPFVMNTKEEIEQTLDELKRGTFL